MEEFGPQITDFVKPSFAKATRTTGGLLGEVLHVDDFGNVITNIREVDLSVF
jgi:S-adenosylmethionine hydrolase